MGVLFSHSQTVFRFRIFLGIGFVLYVASSLYLFNQLNDADSANSVSEISQHASSHSQFVLSSSNSSADFENFSSHNLPAKVFDEVTTSSTSPFLSSPSNSHSTFSFRQSSAASVHQSTSPSSSPSSSSKGESTKSSSLSSSSLSPSPSLPPSTWSSMWSESSSDLPACSVPWANDVACILPSSTDDTSIIINNNFIGNASSSSNSSSSVKTCLVDVVYTYVNPADAAWLAQLKSLGKAYPENRFRDWDELRFSMRSLLQYANWVRRIHLVLAAPTQLPPWLNSSHSRLRIVYHRDLINQRKDVDDESDILPTFNSLVIESLLHRIPGLSNHFLYINNDVFFGREAPLSLFLDRDPTTGRSVYTRYVDWRFHTVKESVDPIDICPRGPDQLSLEQRRHCAQRYEFYLDSHIMQQAFGMDINKDDNFWYAHMPHLWQRCALYEVERRLTTPYLNLSRRNKLRDAATDVSMHMQYEAYLRALAANYSRALESAQTNSRSLDVYWPPNIPPPHQIELNEMVFLNGNNPQPPPPFYLFKVFSNLEVKHPTRWWYEKVMQTAVSNHPVFIGLEDDLDQPKPEWVDRHRKRLVGFFLQQWPHDAPWEQQPPIHDDTGP